MKRAGIQMIFASLCKRASLASSVSQHNAARMPACLFAVMATPLPLPQIKIPQAALPCSTAFEQGAHSRGSLLNFHQKAPGPSPDCLFFVVRRSVPFCNQILHGHFQSQSVVEN